MLYDVAHFLLALVLELLLMRAMTKVVPIRSVVGYCAADFCYFCVAMASQGKILGFPRVALVLFHYSLPVLFATCPLPRRIFGVAAVHTINLLSEALAVFSWAALTGESTMAPTVTESNFLAMLAVYGVIILTCALAFELIITLFRRIYDEGDVSVEFPVIVEMALSPLFFHVINTKLYLQDALTPTTLTGIMAFCILSTLLCFAMLAIARQDLDSQRALASHAASVRQATHSRREVEAIARRAVSVRRLRHDLANQVAVVERLASSGQKAEADRYLDILQQQSRELSR